MLNLYRTELKLIRYRYVWTRLDPANMQKIFLFRVTTYISYLWILIFLYLRVIHSNLLTLLSWIYQWPCERSQTLFRRTLTRVQTIDLLFVQSSFQVVLLFVLQYIQNNNVFSDFTVQLQIVNYILRKLHTIIMLTLFVSEDVRFHIPHYLMC